MRDDFIAELHVMRHRRQSMNQLLRSFAVLVATASLVGCEFEPAIDPLILPDAPPQAFQSAPVEGAEIIETEQETAGGWFYRIGRL